MTWDIIHTIDILLWVLMAASVSYIMFFALVSVCCPKKEEAPPMDTATFYHRYLILYPAYHEDKVIINSVDQFLMQDYPQTHYRLVVISDHMSAKTNKQLRSRPINVLTPVFYKSSKAKALGYAVDHIEGDFDYVVILDADNVVSPDFLSQLNSICSCNYQAIQCHRCAKNSDNGIAILDGVSEEINNTIFRRAHNQIGLSSALIGSGMCFNYRWFCDNVKNLSTAGEDRELEELLLRNKIFIRYVEQIHILDEKVSSQENFQRQRLRWMTAQIQCLLAMLPNIPTAIKERNINYIDKTIQQALIPRSILVVTVLTLSLLMTFIIPVWAAKWWILFGALCLSLLAATPPSLRTRAIFGKLILLPGLTWKMLKNIKQIDRKNKDFLHTNHGQ